VVEYRGNSSIRLRWRQTVNRLGHILLFPLAAVGLCLGGCRVGAAGGSVLLEASAVSNDYKPAAGAYLVSDPMPDQLTPIAKVVVLPFYAQASENKVELRPAELVSGIAGRLSYPVRPYMSGWSRADVIDHAAIVFAPRCWPAIVYADSNPPGGSIWEQPFPQDRIQPLGVDQFLRVMLYRGDRPYDDDVDRAANDNSLLLIFQLNLQALYQAVDAAPTLRPAERAMVYRQLYAVATHAANRLTAGHRKSIYTTAAEKLGEKITTLTEAK